MCNFQYAQWMNAVGVIAFGLLVFCWYTEQCMEIMLSCCVLYVGYDKCNTILPLLNVTKIIKIFPQCVLPSATIATLVA